MNNKLSISSLLIVLFGFVIIVQSGKTAVSTSTIHQTNYQSNTLSQSSWNSLAGPTGGSVSDIVLSPAYPNPETLFAGLRGQGVYRSDDGAFSWQATGLGAWIVRDLAISPDFATDETLLALSGVWPTGYTVHRTIDGGQTWQISSSPASFSAGRRLAISPNFTNDQLVYLVTAVVNTTFVSTDGGDVFTQASGWFATQHINELVFSPAFATDQTLFALVVNDGIYRSTDAGINWQSVENSRNYVALAISPDYANDDTITAVSDTGTIYTSTDDGATWTVGNGVTLGSGGEITIAFSPTFITDRVIMAASSVDDSPVRSLDGGITWSSVGAYDPARAFRDGMIGGNVFALALAPEQDNAGVQFAGTSSGVARSPYQGDGWVQMNEGLPEQSVRSLAIAPDNSDIMLAGTEFYETRYFDSGAAIPGDGNVQWSNDGGETWRHVTGRLGRINEVAFSPDFANDKTAFAAAGMIGQHGLVEGGLYRSIDNSATWTAVFTPTFHAFQSLAISPNFAVDETVWASASTYSSAVGLYQSTNGGDAWANIAPGLNIVSLDVSPNFAVDQTLFGVMGGDGIHRSQDGGGVWIRVLDVPYATALAISPAYGASRTVYAAAGTDVSAPTNIYRSTDNGDTWQELITGLPSEKNGENLKVSSLAFAVDGTVLAGVGYGKNGVETAVYRSSDGGESWQMVDGPIAAAKIYDFASKPTDSFAVFAAVDTGLQRITISQGETAEPVGWQSNGPRGGSGDALGVSPNFANDGIAFTGEWYGNPQASEAGSRIIKSTNFGQNWAVSAAGTAEMGLETAVRDYAFSNNFSADETVFAATGGGLFQSVDGGANWVRNEALYIPPYIITAIAAAPDYATSHHLMATGYYGGLFISQDDGASWTTVTSDIVNSMAYSPVFASDGTVFMADSHHDGVDFAPRVVKTLDNGVTWTPIYSASVGTLAVSPNFAIDQTVFAGGEAFHKSIDGGTSWITQTVVADSGTIQALAVSPNYAVDQTLFAGMDKGLYYSLDGGSAWQSVPAYENTPILSLAISPEWPLHAVLLVGTNTGVSRLLTADPSSGVTREESEGLVIAHVSAMAMNADETMLLSGTYNRGLYASEDDGQTWQPYGFNGSSSFTNIGALVFSPDYASDQTVFASYGGKYSSYYRSTDAGVTWDYIFGGIYTNASIAVSPNFASDQTLFVTGEDSGELEKSTDGGDTWHEILSRESIPNCNLIALPPDYPGNDRLFIGSVRQDNQGFWYSLDDGATWQQAATGLVSDHTLKSLKVSPDFVTDQTLLAISSSNYQEGVFKSVDAGVNWTLVNNGIPNVYLNDVAFSPNYALDQTVYLVTNHDLYRSIDGGENWKVVGSPPGQPVLENVLVDSEGSVFVSSESGVWRFNGLAQEVIVNGRFEATGAWDLPTTTIPADYSSQVVYNGQRSMLVGLDNGPHVNGFSSARQTFTLPADLLSAQLSFSLYPITGEETAVSASSHSPTDVINNVTDSVAGDAQYVYLYDANTNDYLETLYWDLSNGQAWQRYTVNLSAYKGQNLMLLFGTMNDGQNGATGMYVDDVSLLFTDDSLYPEKIYLPIIMKQ